MLNMLNSKNSTRYYTEKAIQSPDFRPSSEKLRPTRRRRAAGGLNMQTAGCDFFQKTGRCILTVSPNDTKSPQYIEHH